VVGTRAGQNGRDLHRVVSVAVRCLRNLFEQEKKLVSGPVVVAEGGLQHELRDPFLLHPPVALPRRCRNTTFTTILGARIADCEDELPGNDLFSDLKDRGLRRSDPVISDGHKGIRNVVQRPFHGCRWQMCQVHFIRVVLKRIPGEDHKFVIAVLKDPLNDPRRHQGCILERESRGFSRAADTVERFHFDVLNYRRLPNCSLETNPHYHSS